MISVSNFELRIGARQLIAPVSFSLSKGSKVGLVGRNGAGKTTMMRLLAGEEDRGAAEYTGTISRSGPVAYLPQDTTGPSPEPTGIARILSVRGIDKLIARIAKAEAEMSSSTGARQTRAMERYVRLDQEFTMSGGWAANSEAFQIAAALGLEKSVLEQDIHTLSGGQRRRVELARVLFSGADTLLLDEPTNHLDHDSVIWLRDWIRSYSGAVLLISHDVGLLRDTVNRVFYLDAAEGQLEIYNLGWEQYLVQRSDDERRRRKERAGALRKAQVLQAQGEKMRAKATKAVAAQQMLRRAEQLRQQAGEDKKGEKVAHIRFPDPAPCGRVPLTAEALSKSYGSLEVFTGLDLAVDRGAKVAILGENGAGKTTLLRVLAGLEPPDSGEVVAGHGLRLGYYAQEHETLDPDHTVYEAMAAAAPQLDQTELRSVLGQFLFGDDDVAKPVRVLSGGEKTRLALATLVISAANVLLLDEPTNNLDPASREEILKALASFSGAVLLVSHDPGAVEALGPDRVLLLPEGDEDLWDQDYLELVTIR